MISVEELQAKLNKRHGSRRKTADALKKNGCANIKKVIATLKIK